MRATTIRRGILLGLSLAATLTVAACAAGNQPGSAGPGTSHTVPPPSASTPASAGISTASPTASAAAAGSGVPMCTAADLRASLGGGAGAGMSQDHTGVQLRDIGSSACSLRGYPGVFWVAGANDHQVGSAAVREPESASSPEQTVTLASTSIEESSRCSSRRAQVSSPPAVGPKTAPSSARVPVSTNVMSWMTG
jgi:hypothetical protein